MLNKLPRVINNEVSIDFTLTPTIECANILTATQCTLDKEPHNVLNVRTLLKAPQCTF